MKVLHIYHLQRVILISLRVTMVTVNLKATCVMVTMTVETTVMKKDVVNVYMYYITLY